MSDIPPTQALDRVLYLAQLVSTPKDIDPILDTVRAITAKRQSSDALLSDAEVVQLEQAYFAIKNYLLYKDPLRNFTDAELERKVNRALHPELQGPLVRWPWLIITSIWLLYIGCGVLAYLQTARLPIAMGSGMGLLLVVIPLLFLLPLKAFRPELRRAYVLICLGVVATAVASAPLSAVQFFPDLLLDHPLFKHATGIALFLLGTIPYYAGIARFARLQNVRSRLLSPGVMAGLLLAAIGVVALLPHPAIASNRLLYDIPIVGLTFNAIFAGAIVVLGIKVIRTLTPRYAKAVKWIVAAQVILAASSLQMAGWLLITPQPTATELAVETLPGIFAGFLMLQAGYEFYKAAQDL